MMEIAEIKTLRILRGVVVTLMFNAVFVVTVVNEGIWIVLGVFVLLIVTTDRYVEI